MRSRMLRGCITAGANRAGRPPVVPLASAILVAASLALAGCAGGSNSAADAEEVKAVAPPAPDSGARTAALPRAGGAGAPESRWLPDQGARWHLQLDGMPRANGVAVYDIDGADASAADVARLKASGAHVICYFSAGTWEDWREDARAFPGRVVGTAMEDWEGESWVDVRRLDQLLPIMAERMDDCAAKGFDAVDPDNVDGYLHDTGFTFTRQDSARYITELARLAHDRGLAMGLKNGIEVLPLVGDDVDFAVNEECQAWDECEAYDDFVDAGKAVFNVEYEGKCTTPRGFSSIRADYDLDGPTRRCR